MENIFSRREVVVRKWYWFVLTIVCIALFSAYKMQPASTGIPTTGALSYQLTAAERERLEGQANTGDCDAALKLSRHYSIAQNDIVHAVPWLRLAAHCKEPHVLNELISLLLGIGPIESIEPELDQLLKEMETRDPSLAKTARDDVARARARQGERSTK